MAAALAELGIVRLGAPLRFNAGITRGDTLWADVYRDDGSFVHVKLSELVSLREEARTYEAAWGTFHAFMARPLGYAAREGWELFVTEGVPHGSFDVARFMASPSSRGLAGRICELFVLARRAPGTSAQDLMAVLARLQERFAPTPYGPLLARWRAAGGERDLLELPPSPQHGDFVANNLATCRGRLIVFDWEDFAKVSWPGFDLCTLVMTSLDPEVVAAIGAHRQPGETLARHVPVLAPACEAIGLTPARFWSLAPLYLVQFLELKGTYGQDVRRRTESLLDAFRHATATPA